MSTNIQAEFVRHHTKSANSRLIFQPLSHSEACNRARLVFSELGFTLFRREVGMFKTERGTPKRLGTPGEGDLSGWDRGTGIFAAAEVKTGKAVRSKQQKQFAAAVTNAGGFYLVVRYSADHDGDELIRQAVALWRQGRGKC